METDPLIYEMHFASSNLDFALELGLNKIDRDVALVHKQCFVTVWSKY